ncbi:phosphoribosyltransferase family protein [Moheibacter sediminis]|uniref:Phosphoribosyl transferase domain-containing protein n=1 Tax=Moheibacter sediminis TaxID=1434700 RepID=A0A1W1Z754_9FLAO|nr:phosphoribosyltransferase [Moheibacter sediminis]SMC44196.1 Phosphoribosyl transferase domain-containing protein [Moheibacter sediminis]
MKVLDFKKDGFINFLNENFQELIEVNKKILVLGIADGGIPVAEIVYQFFKNKTQNEINLDFIKVQRPSTKQKKANPITEKSLKFVFSILPKFVLDYLRIFEHKKFSKRSQSDLEREIKLNSKINFSLYNLILVVDDAVDSGASMKTVVDFVKEKTENSVVVKAVSVVLTQQNPIFLPDYFWLRDVLIRFPWSLDGRK